MNNLEKEFLPYEQSLALKELGFDEPCFGYYEPNKKFKYLNWETFKDFPYLAKNSEWQDLYGAPLYQQAFRWFREKYSWQHSMEPTADQHRFEVGYNYWIWNSKTGEEYHTMPKNRPTGDWEYETYEESELECLKKLIEIVKNK
jgi:hypothetical protein